MSELTDTLDPLPVSVAPMMDWTDRHCRVFHRMLSPSARLYTEMVHCAAVLRGDRDRLLDNRDVRGPVALQLGGSDPAQMAEAAAVGVKYGYDEININVGCPSDRVQSGHFGACLMAHPETVAACVRAMRARIDVPVTVKTRIGIDDDDSDAFFFDFVDQVCEAGCTHLIVHARIAVLAGLSPKQNREIPPLNYARVHRLKTRCPDLHVTINGGLRSPVDVAAHTNHVDGAMIGRAAYQTPWLLAELEHQRGSALAPPSRHDVMRQLMDYAQHERARGIPLRAVARHTLGLFQGQPGARRFRRTLSEGMHRPDADVSVIEQALSHVLAA
ncbi:MAG: tRNA dihydrouridine(20/20a) synthase DusA [Pseudomonadota bacterium]